MVQWDDILGRAGQLRPPDVIEATGTVNREHPIMVFCLIGEMRDRMASSMADLMASDPDWREEDHEDAGLGRHLRAPGGPDAEGVVPEFISAFGILGTGGDGNREGDGAGGNRPAAGYHIAPALARPAEI